MKKETKLKLFSMLIGLALSLLIVEASVRIYLFRSAAFSYDKMRSWVHLNQTSFTQIAETNDILYELSPNQDGFFRLANMKTNSFGQRDKTYSLVKPPKTIRGAFVGDSYTMGASVEIEDVFHSQMEERLNKKADAENISYEFINFGVSGYNLLNYWGVLEKKVMAFNPDFILIGFCAGNDMKLPNKRHYAGNFNFRANSVNAFSKYYTQELWDAARRKSKTQATSVITSKQKEWISSMFARYSSFSKEHQVPIIIDYLSILDMGNDMEIVKKIAHQNDLYFVDSSHHFINKDAYRNRINFLDGHPNAKANRIFAEVLLAYKPLFKIIEDKKNQF